MKTIGRNPCWIDTEEYTAKRNRIIENITATLSLLKTTSTATLPAAKSSPTAPQAMEMSKRRSTISISSAATKRRRSSAQARDCLQRRASLVFFSALLMTSRATPAPRTPTSPNQTETYNSLGWFLASPTSSSHTGRRAREAAVDVADAVPRTYS